MRAAIRYWELRRLIYNGVLALFALIWLIGTWPHFRPAMTLESLFRLSILAMLANLCYSAAYVAELFMRGAAPNAPWRRGRATLLVIGILFAIVFENYWIADEIYPFVR